MSNNMIDAGDLGFAAADPRVNVDFRLAKSSAVFKTGFKAISYASIGPYGCCANGCKDC
jgi:hypothetical protein|tara:strand:+ start:647 stop:823 length:177 start_codon:yes stop_codon:yes gene_type:complete